MQIIYDGVTVEVEPVATSYAMYNGYYGYYASVPALSLSICFYCGSRLKSSIERCPACGARDWSRKRYGK